MNIDTLVAKLSHKVCNLEEKLEVIRQIVDKLEFHSRGDFELRCSLNDIYTVIDEEESIV